MKKDEYIYCKNNYIMLKGGYYYLIKEKNKYFITLYLKNNYLDAILITSDFSKDCEIVDKSKIRKIKLSKINNIKICQGV